MLLVSPKISIFAVRKRSEKVKNRGAIERILLFLLVILAGCSGKKSAFDVLDAPHHDAELRQIAELMQDNPEMAFDSVVKYENVAENWSVADRNEWHLRYVESAYKTRQLLDSCPDLEEVAQYYDSLSLLFPEDETLLGLQARAYYYKGVMASMQNEDLEATRSFLHVLSLMEKNDQNQGNADDKRFIALTHTRLGEVLYYYGINDLARKAFIQAADFFSDLNDTVALASMLRNEAAICQAEKSYDMALAKFSEAQGLVPIDSVVFCHSIGCKLYEMQQFDSAAAYLERSFDLEDRFARTDAASRLADIYRRSGELEKEVYYTRYYVGNALMESNLASAKMEIEFLCSNHEKEVEATGDTKQNADFLKYLIPLVSVLAIFGILVYVIVRNRRRIKHIEKQITTIEENRQKDEINEKSGKEPAITQKSDNQLKIGKSAFDTFDEAWQHFNECQVCMKIKKSVKGKDIMIKSVAQYPHIKLSEKDLIDLVQAANSSFGDFSLRLLNAYPDLTTGDVRHCALVLLGMNDAEIAALEGISYSGTNRRTKKISGVFMTNLSLQTFLMSYLKSLF